MEKTEYIFLLYIYKKMNVFIEQSIMVGDYILATVSIINIKKSLF